MLCVFLCQLTTSVASCTSRSAMEATTRACPASTTTRAPTAQALTRTVRSPSACSNLAHAQLQSCASQSFLPVMSVGICCGCSVRGHAERVRCALHQPGCERRGQHQLRQPTRVPPHRHDSSGWQLKHGRAAELDIRPLVVLPAIPHLPGAAVEYFIVGAASGPWPPSYYKNACMAACRVMATPPGWARCRPATTPPATATRSSPPGAHTGRAGSSGPAMLHAVPSAGSPGCSHDACKHGRTMKGLLAGCPQLWPWHPGHHQLHPRSVVRSLKSVELGGLREESPAISNMRQGQLRHQEAAHMLL